MFFLKNKDNAMMKNLKKKKLSNFLSSCGGVIIVMILMIPIIWTISSSFRPKSEIFSIPATFISRSFTMENYRTIISMNEFRRYLLNSVIVSISATVLNIFLASLAAFSFSRFRFKGKNILLVSVILTQFFPAATLLVPMYMAWAFVRLLNTYICLIITYTIITLPLSIWMLTAFFNTVPQEIDEAAEIDGCSKIRTYISIVIPLSKPGIVASATYIFITVWQEFLFAITFISVKEMRTLPVGLYSFIGERVTDWGPLMAGAMFSMLPVFILFMLLQKHFISGVMGAVKG